MKTFLRTIAAAASLSFCAAAPAQSVGDPNLKVQTWVGSGLDLPIGAAVFNTRGDMMVIEKNSGKVKVVRNRVVKQTLLDLPVATDGERGLLGMALSPTFSTDNFVYLFHTPSTTDGGTPQSNKISRYRYDGSALVFDRKVIDLPVTPGPNHNGGRITFGPDGRLYTVIGDVNINNANNNFSGQAVQNTAAVLRLNPSGTTPTGNPFTGDAKNIYAYGIRNSFGIAFDPVTGDLWDTENGPSSFDEINRVFKGFNSGWEDIMGPVSRNGGEQPAGLASLGAAAVYADPKFSWDGPIAPTDLEFLPNARLGSAYVNDMFVGTTKGGKLLRFDLTGTRKSLRLTGGLADLVADNRTGNLYEEQDSIVFGDGFGIISDLFAGSGGMYVVSLTNNAIYRITTNSSSGQGRSAPVPEPAAGIALAAAAVLMRRRRAAAH